MKIKNYIINDDLSVDVHYNVDLSNSNLTEIPVQFRLIKGHFYCQYNLLKTLKGFPREVQGNLNCSNNQLKS